MTAPASAVGPDLSVQMSGPSTATLPNGEITYSITVQNTGTQPATGVVVTDPIPSTLALVSTSSPAPCSDSAGTIQCNLGTLGVGATVHLSLTMGLFSVSGAPGNTFTVTNTVTVTPADSTSSDNSATVQTAVTLDPVAAGPGVVPPPPVKANPSFTG